MTEDKNNNEDLVEDDLVLDTKESFIDGLRYDIDTAVAAYNFLDPIDASGPLILKAGIKKEINEAKVNCLKIIIKAIEKINQNIEESIEN